MALMVPNAKDITMMFANIEESMVNMTGGCPCRCTNCNSCACGRCYVLEDSLDVDIWE